MWIRVPSRLLLSLALIATASSALAAKSPKPKPPSASPGGAPAAGGSEKPWAEWAKLTKDAEQKKGFFTLWKKRDNLYLQIDKDQVDQPFLYVVSLARGIGSNFTLGGLPLDDRMLQWERHGDRILLVQASHQQLAIAIDHGEQVVEVVRDSSRQPAQALQLL